MFGKIISMFLAVVVVFSTLSFTVEKHYCMGRLANYSLLGNVEGCGMPIQNNDEETILNKVPCCNDVVELIESTNNELKAAKEFSLDQMYFLTAFFTSYVNLFEGLQENIIPFRGHSPPLLVKDIQVLYETYLI